MNDGTAVVGRVLHASTAGFSVGCARPLAEQTAAVPEFGALVKAHAADGSLIYGLVQNVTVVDDAFVRQLVAAGVEAEEIIEDQRQNRQVPIVADVLAAGTGQGQDVRHWLPPRPPSALDLVYSCNNDETVRFTTRHDWMRTVLAAGIIPVDQLLVAALRLAAAARPSSDRERYLVGAGRELARLLAVDLPRLDGILAGLRQ